MKTKTTKKFLRECYHIINIGNGELQTLIDGYDCIGKVVSFELRQKYESKAKEIMSKYHNGSKYWTEKRVTNTFDMMIRDFIKEAY